VCYQYITYEKVLIKLMSYPDEHLDYFQQQAILDPNIDLLQKEQML